MQAITTKYLPATNCKGSRIKATAERGSITIGYPHELSGDECHREAVRQLLDKFAKEDAEKYSSKYEDAHWGEFVTGQIPGGDWVHVLIGRHNGILRKHWGDYTPGQG